MSNNKKVAVLLGGTSNERDISIKSGTAVYEALISLNKNAVCIDVLYDPVYQIRQAGADVAFIALHGKFGEDGTVQAMLERESIPYTGSGPKASRLAMNKIASKIIFEKMNLPTPKYVALSKENMENWDSYKMLQGLMRGLGSEKINDIFPVIVKPNTEGSSIGMSVVSDMKSLTGAIEKAFVYDNEILIEDFFEGDDITVGILDNKPLPAVRIKPKDGIYDYKSKYTNGATEYIVPADIDKDVSDKIQKMALDTHLALGCRCFSRVDLRINKNNDVTVLEANTIPGLTSTSLLPKAAKAAGIDFQNMCMLMLGEYGKEI